MNLKKAGMISMKRINVHLKESLENAAAK